MTPKRRGLLTECFLQGIQDHPHAVHLVGDVPTAGTCFIVATHLPVVKVRGHPCLPPAPITPLLPGGGMGLLGATLRPEFERPCLG